MLTDAVKALGNKTEAPNDFQSSGSDFRESKQVTKLKEKLSLLAAEANFLVVHLAPPCATFSRARDRSFRTRLRNKWCPEGLPG